MKSEALLEANTDLHEVMASLPELLETLRSSYTELENRAERVEDELSRTNTELNQRVLELDVIKRHTEAILDSIPNGVVVRNAEDQVIRINGAAQELMGADLEGFSKGHVPDLIPNGEAQSITNAKGDAIVVAAIRADVRLTDGTHNGSVEIIDDQTEQTALRERLHASDKMAALGTMAAGIAHEIRNPLNAVKGFASLMRRRDDMPEQCGRWSSLIVAGVEEVDAIIENLLSFGSPERLRLEEIDPRELFNAAAALAFRDSTKSIESSVEINCPTLIGDHIKLRQAVRNLLANAVDIQPEHARVHAAITLENDQVCIRVADAGSGVAPELRRRILDPFFTTRAEGTGLGLALVSTIVRLHGGTVEISPDPSHLGGADIGFRIPFRSVSPSGRNS
ncbi:MAG: signal transduction histidine kinase [Planctomycetota bacterium]|jgi:signal transduction histidine kinase